MDHLRTKAQLHGMHANRIIQQIQDRTTMNIPSSTARTLAPQLKRNSINLMRKYYPNNPLEAQPDLIYDIMQNTQFATRLWHIDQQRTCEKTILTMEAISLVPELDQREYARARDHAHRYFSTR